MGLPQTASVSTLGVTAGTQVAPGPAVLTYVNAHPDGVAAVTVEVYNGTSISDPKVFAARVAATGPSLTETPYVYCGGGIFVVTTGAGGQFHIGYG
jgi:ABC-type Fe3+-hydroxamate transport system substrate-binding protein